jgi:hypothetical protein
MKNFIIKKDLIFILLLVIILSIGLFIKIERSYSISSFSRVTKDLNVIRRSIDEFSSLYKRFPTEKEVKGFDEGHLFIHILMTKYNERNRLLTTFEFPSTPLYVKSVDGIDVEIDENNTIKICSTLENLGLNNNLFSSNGGWIYSPSNGELRANLQDREARNKKTHQSRPKWGQKVDWYYK